MHYSAYHSDKNMSSIGNCSRKLYFQIKNKTEMIALIIEITNFPKYVCMKETALQGALVTFHDNLRSPSAYMLPHHENRKVGSGLDRKQSSPGISSIFPNVVKIEIFATGLQSLVVLTNKNEDAFLLSVFQDQKF